jgi:ubiquinone/menaquinone biosynthesis C-methylase UbiE
VSETDNTHVLAWQKRGALHFLRRAGIRVGQVVLDFGCGEGNYTKAAARIVGALGTVYALDKNPSALDALMRAASEDGLTNIHRLDTTGTMPLPLGDTSVDVVLLYDVLHLVGSSREAGKTVNRSTVTDRRRLLKELHRVLKPAGRVSAYCPHLPTHTDVESEEQIKEEFEAEGFAAGRDFHAELRHNGSIVRGRVLSFVRRTDPG